MRSLVRSLILAVVAAAAPGLPSIAQAADWPTKPVRIVVPFGAGGSVDATARILAEELKTRLGQSFIVENKAGASSIIGSQFVRNAAPDGYTLLFTTSTLTALPAIKKIAFDPRDFSPIATVVEPVTVLIVSNKVPVANLPELLDLARKNPGKLNYASPGEGSGTHLNTELFAKQAGIKMLHVPYSSSAQIIMELIAGRIDLTLNNLITIDGQLKNGDLKVFGVTSAKRSPSAPDIPTVAEAGLPGFEQSNWFGLLGPGGMNPAVVATLNDTIQAILKDPAVVKKLQGSYLDIAAKGPADFAKIIADEIPRWRVTAKAAGIDPQP